MESTGQGDHEITQLLAELRRGCADAEADLIPLVYDELHRLAHKKMAGERPDHTLQTTALVHEAYLKLVGSKQFQWNNRVHFFAVASEIMRQILVDYARRKNAEKRGAGGIKVEMSDRLAVSDDDLDRILVIDDALRRLKTADPRQAQVVTLKFFGGLDYSQIAEALGISERTVKRDWKHARSWLYGEMLSADSPS